MKPARTRVIVLSAALSVLAAPSARAHTGYGLAVDPQGRVCFIDTVRNRLVCLDRDARLTVLATGKHGNNVAVDEWGNFYLQHFNESVWRVSARGEAQLLFSGGAVGSLDEFLTVDNTGNVYLAAGNDFTGRVPRLLKRAPDGSISTLADAQAGLGKVVSAAWGPEGALYLSESNRVLRFSPDGRLSTVASGFERLMGIAVDARGIVFVADSDAFKILKITPQGAVTAMARTHLPWKPAGVAVSSDSVYVLERKFVPLPFLLERFFKTQRVRRLAPDGRITTMATVGESGGLIVGALLGLAVLAVVAKRRRRRSAALGTLA